MALLNFIFLDFNIWTNKFIFYILMFSMVKCTVFFSIRPREKLDVRMSSASYSRSKPQQPKVIKNNTLAPNCIPHVSIFAVKLGNQSQTNFAYIKKLT